MKKIVLLLLTLSLVISAVVISCTKTVEVPLDYTVTDTNSNALTNIYIPDSGTFVFPVWVKFLTGTAGDTVSLSFSGLPADVRVTPDSYSGIPSYVEDFVFYTNHATDGTYPITLTSYSRTVGYTSYNFNLGVIPANCSASFITSLTGASSCNPHYTATGDTSSYPNTMYVTNFGGFGPDVNVEVILSCKTDSVFIPQGRYGNSVTLSGQGIFTNNKMIIWYNATSTPFGPQSCTDTLTIN